MFSHQSRILIETKIQEIYLTKKRPSFWEKGLSSDVIPTLDFLSNTSVKSRRKNASYVKSHYPHAWSSDSRRPEKKVIQLSKVSGKQCWVRGGKKVHLPLDQCHVLYVPINQKNRNNRNVHETTLTETQKILRFKKKYYISKKISLFQKNSRRTSGDF